MVSRRSPFVGLLGGSRTPIPAVVTKGAVSSTPKEKLKSRFALIIDLQEALYVDAERKGHYYFYYVYEVENTEEDSLDAKEKASAEDAADADITNTSFPISSLDGSHDVSRAQDIHQLISCRREPELQSKTLLNEEQEMVKSFLERRARGNLSKIPNPQLSNARKCAKSLGYILTAYRCERAINEVCSQLKIDLPFKAIPGRVRLDRQAEGFAGVVEEGILGPVDEDVGNAAQETLVELRRELNMKVAKKVFTLSEAATQTLQ